MSRRLLEEIAALFGKTAVWLLLLPALHAATAAATVQPDAAADALAGQILQATGIRGGLVVELGCGEGRLLAALAERGAYLVQGLDADAQRVTAARRYLQARGLYGKVSVERWSGRQIPYTDNLVDLVVSQQPGEISNEELLRVLVPGGVAYLRQGQTWQKVVKPRPPNIDDWTHFLHGPDNNAVAHDTGVAAPYHLQWAGDPAWARSHDHLASVSALVSSAGRIFAIVDEAPTVLVALPARWQLVARNAFNGVVLWKRPVGPWEGHLRGFRAGPPELPRRLVAIAERVYVTLGYGQPLCALDAATGETVRTYEETEGAQELVYADGVLYVVVGDVDRDEAAAAARRFGASPAARNRRLLALEAATGKLRWTISGPVVADLMPLTLAVAQGRVVLETPDAILCLDAGSGRRLWRTQRPLARKRPSWSAPTLVVYGDVVLSADRPRPAAGEESNSEPQWTLSSKPGEAKPGELAAFSLDDGRQLWSCPCREGYNSPVDVLVADGLVWTGDLVMAKDPGFTEARDVNTGEVKRRRPADPAVMEIGMAHHRCYRNKATTQYLLTGRAGVEVIDMASGDLCADHWLRGTCQYGVMPCNGLLYVPPHSCACFIEAKLNSFNALASRRQGFSPDHPADDDRRLEAGPAYVAPPPPALRLPRWSSASNPQSLIPDPSDWPTYRHDAARSGLASTQVSADVAPAWQTNLGGGLSSVVVAEGRLYVAQIDAHAVHALDAASGRRLWSYTCGGRIDSPPTVNGGKVLFGSADGFLYCLRAGDGGLVWRFRAAPEDRRIVAYGQLESPWPVPGSVLVRGDEVWAVAGRSSYVDGGMWLYRLDAATGKKIAARRLDDRDPQTGREPQQNIHGFDMSGLLPDVLSTDGASVYLRHARFDLSGARQPPDVPHLFSAAGFLDDSWWHRTYWMFGTQMASGWGHWFKPTYRCPAGRLLVCDAERIYGFGRDTYATFGGHVGLDPQSNPHAFDFTGAAVSKTSYRLFCTDRRMAGENDEAAAAEPGKAVPRGASKAKVRYHWLQTVPMYVRAMVLAGKSLFLAGPPDPLAGDDPQAAWEGKRGGLLWAVSPADGQRQAAYPLGAPPVFDGMIAAAGRLYLATMDGQVISFQGR